MTDRCRSCGAHVIFVPSAKLQADGTRARMILNSKPEKLVVLGSLISSLDRDDGLVVGAQYDDAEIVARIVDVYTPHHATCPQAEQWQGRRR